MRGSCKRGNRVIWSAPFRPFYFAASFYAPLLVIAWVGPYLGLWADPQSEVPLPLRHGHEFIFGFCAAIITGFVLTALPSWAGTKEITGRPLMLLALLWLAGRMAFWASPWLPSLVPAIIDGLLLPALFAMVMPQLLRARNKRYLLFLPVLLALITANLMYHHGLATSDHAQSGQALRLAVYELIVLYVMSGGVLTPLFTGNVLREKGRGDQTPFSMPLEIAAVGVVLLLAVLDLAAAPPTSTGAAALACTLLHGWRTARWQGWRAADVPLVAVMHLGFAWLILAFALRAMADLTGLVPAHAWLHAFAVGSLGLMMLVLMTRVALRHTGRPPVVSPAMLAAYAVMFAAALLRLAATVLGLGNTVIALAALLWGAAFAMYFGVFWKVLLAPSLPRR